jgi:hypothetical protein
MRRGISIIEQDIFLFSRSISENIAFGKPGATQAEIEIAARQPRRTSSSPPSRTATRPSSAIGGLRFQEAKGSDLLLPGRF